MSQTIQKLIAASFAALLIMPSSWAIAGDKDKKFSSERTSISKFQSNRSRTSSFRKPSITRPNNTIRPSLNKPQNLGSFKPNTPSRPIFKPNTPSLKPKFPSTKNPLVNKPGIKFPGTIKPGTKLPGIIKPGIVKPGNTIKPGVIKPGTIKPGIVKPGVIKPGVVKPGINLPGIVKPGVVKPGVIKPGNLVGKPQVKLPGLNKFENLIGKIKPQGPQGPQVIKPMPLGNVKLPQNLKLPLNNLAQNKNFQAKKLGIHRLSLRPRCHWWFDMVIGCNWHFNHCHWYNYCYTPGYWDCWTPCNFHVIHCPPHHGFVTSTWYFGLDCILIPDMAAYGVQGVVPNSPAAIAGLNPGDMIVSINGMGIVDETVMAEMIRTSGGILELGILQDGAVEPELVVVKLWRVQRYTY